MKTDHLIVRPDHVLCTRCFDIAPIHQGHGTPMPTLIAAYELHAKKHQNCEIKTSRKS